MVCLVLVLYKNCYFVFAKLICNYVNYTFWDTAAKFIIYGAFICSARWSWTTSDKGPNCFYGPFYDSIETIWFLLIFYVSFLEGKPNLNMLLKNSFHFWIEVGITFTMMCYLIDIRQKKLSFFSDFLRNLIKFDVEKWVKFTYYSNYPPIIECFKCILN